ncbi:DUF1658 domain-containing protein [Coxiella burnetii]|uniref:Hypothetical cytosolic protein n=1 Tax=Coxiella burnetii (strain Dugway 5J108-111) TaxID=434922 RepID=B5XHL0_COXBN|nr:hypothetical cytosolic protein [Coxiella burnetii Dugway 5J108-111]OYK79508.1 DUF1658 domain-containing protein [Coxiella burnetii]OYK81589.1 DUF1658 domain-containing protein [Coxiella burnetii]
MLKPDIPTPFIPAFPSHPRAGGGPAHTCAAHRRCAWFPPARG